MRSVVPQPTLLPSIWSFLEKMRNVTRFDLAFAASIDINDHRDAASHILFPAARDVRLSGKVRPEVIRAIFDSMDLSKLRRLAFDNLRDPGHRSHDIQSRDTQRDVPDRENSRSAGIMRGVLPTLSGRCPGLLFFYYRKSVVMRENSRAAPGDRRDSLCYAEVSTFLSSLGASLEAFHFELSVPENSMHGRGAVRHGQSVSGHLPPKDQKVLYHICPVLVQTQWQNLQKVSLVGVGDDQGPRPWLETEMAKLKTSVCGKVEVTYEGLSDRPCISDEDVRVWVLQHNRFRALNSDLGF